MKNLIRSEEEQFRKQEAEIARKTHEIASLEKSISQRFIDSISSSLYKVSFAGRPFAQIQFVKECCTSAARLFEDS